MTDKQPSANEMALGERAAGKPPITPPRLPLEELSTDLHKVAGRRHSVFALAEGDVAITFPEGLSAESVDDLDGFLKIFLNRVRREAKGRPAN